MKRAVFVLLIVLVSSVMAYTWYNRAQSVAEINTSLVNFNSALKEAQAESVQYAGGLLQALISVRIETIKTTIAMLEQKRQSLFHRIMLTYTVAGASVQPADQDRLGAIQADIDQVNQRIQEVIAENDRYSGGLIKSLLEMRIQTEKQTLAGLNQRYAFAKHGMTHLEVPTQKDSPAPAKERPTVPDKDGL